MDLEFDKEIDGILKRSKGGRGVLVGDDPPEKHVDADTVAAFAENALPQASRLMYIEHFASCDRCRQTLSHAIAMNAEAPSQAAAGVVSPLATEHLIPWYARLLNTRNLALAMGALVLTFSAGLGYLLLQNAQRGSDGTVVQVSNRQAPIRPIQSESAELNANSSTATSATADPNERENVNRPAIASNVAPAPEALASNTARVAPGADLGKTADREDDVRLARERQQPPTELKSDSAGSAPPAPPPPATVTADGVMTQREVAATTGSARKEVPAKDEDGSRMKKRAEEFRSRDLPAPAAKSGPARSGPLQNQVNQQNKLGEMPVTRGAGGKTFNNRDGAWYDSAYRGQATQNVRRGTAEYKALDGGLRSIADAIGGTVVVVWKSKAYRID